MPQELKGIEQQGSPTGTEQYWLYEPARGRELESSPVERNLWVWVDSNMNQ